MNFVLVSLGCIIIVILISSTGTLMNLELGCSDSLLEAC